MATRDFDYLYHHLFLPPCVPQSNDQKSGAGDRNLVERLIQLAPSFRDLNDSQYYASWSAACRMLFTFGTLHRDNKSISRNALRETFREIEDGSIVVLHVALQNSALIVRRSGDEYVFESFEASPPAAEVLAAQTALQWDFPSRAIAIPSSTFEHSSFQGNLAEFIEMASVEPVKQFAATTLKAGSLAFESRDTSTPAIIGQLLMAILEANGRKYAATLTRKRVYDEVCWSDGAENPWRRSAAWLVLRVGLQRTLCFLLGGYLGTVHYKFFICFMMSSVLRELCAQRSYPADHIAFARTKLARRVAKLQRQKDESSPQLAKAIETLFLIHKKVFSQALDTANAYLTEVWNAARQRGVKRVLPLPRRADQGSMILSLSHCRGFLQRILVEALYGRAPTKILLETRSRAFVHWSWPKVELRENRSIFDYLNLADYEAQLKRDTLHTQDTLGSRLKVESNNTCVEIMRDVGQYLKLALTAYKSDPESLSLMLITILESWKALDAEALTVYPLLAQYDPGFPRNLLYPLQVCELTDMRRLQEIEQYLEIRRNTANSSLPSIFGDLSRKSFGVRFFDRCTAMQELLASIESADQDAKLDKEREWKEKSGEYEGILKEAADTACLFMEDEFDPLKRRHDDRRCRKHYLERKAARMRIQVHEALLPMDDFFAKAVVFELLVPPGFAAWRDCTWQILQLARSSPYSNRTPQVLLEEYAGYKSYRKPTKCNITLASRTKSFLNTHYAQVPFPTSLDQVCLPHGLKYGLYDHSQALWTAQRLENPCFADLCSPHLPTKSAYARLRRFLHPTFEGQALSGNETIASQTRCPKNLTIAEYTAFQDLRLGHGIQWMRLLRELASSNLNFGTPEVGTLVTVLALMAGPPEGQSPLRATHWVFNDSIFCGALATQIRRRLESVAPNWREGQTVYSLTVILQRFWSMASSTNARREAEDHLLYVRKMTYDWIRLLRHEICNAKDIEIAQKRSKAALMASLICRKTFLIEATDTSDTFKPAALTCFLESSFALKDNLPKNDPAYIAKMPEAIRILFTSDVKLLHRLETKLRCSIQSMPAAVDEAVNSVWAEAEGDSPRKFTRWDFLSTPHDGWITARSISSAGLLQLDIHVDIFEGTLLVDGQPLGRLPDEFTRQGFFRQIFGNRVFLTYPSSIPGMSYMLASLFQQHEIHFGFRDGTAFLRARFCGKILEMLPPTIFESSSVGDAPDLPIPLIDDRVHWLDLVAQIIEIRPYGTMWSSKPSDWRINLRSSQANRRGSLLVDPGSSIFNRVAMLIEPFEDRRKMIIYQPEKENLSLQMPGLELTFRVNHEGLLGSRQLRAVIDNDQDAGTLYGLTSSLVLRDILVADDRSIIVALGPAKIQTSGSHVKVHINHTGYYARFFINKVLGRLECASEPRLIYFKAYCHAVTSGILPDPLTKRSGTDEAMHCLKAGSAQPWAPVDGESYRILSAIAGLSPERVYYPEKLKVLQKVIWRETLIPNLQDDDFRPIVRAIMHQCTLLHRFHLGSEKPPDFDQVGDEHLSTRARLRCHTYQAAQHQNTSSALSDRQYDPRDGVELRRTANAYEAASLVATWSRSISASRDLASIMQEWPTIQGFNEEFGLCLFDDLINIDIAANWGSLFKLCQGASEAQDRFKLMFLFGTVSFNTHIDMVVVRSLIAVSIMEEFKSIHLPVGSTFSHFHLNQVPTLEYLMQYGNPFRTPYPDDERALLSITLHSKQRRKLENAQLKHEEQSRDSCKAFGHHLLLQWPCRDPSVSDLGKMPLFDGEQAFLAVQPEWVRLVDNYQLSQHLIAVQSILNTCPIGENDIKTPAERNEVEYFPTSPAQSVQPTTRDLVYKLGRAWLSQRRQPLDDYSKATENRFVPSCADNSLSMAEARVVSQACTNALPHLGPNPQNDTSTLIPELHRIVSLFASSDDPTRRAYGQDLERSMQSLQSLQSIRLQGLLDLDTKIDAADLDVMITSSSAGIQAYFEAIRAVMAEDNQWLESGGLLPNISPISLLDALHTFTEEKGPSVARDVLITYGQLIIGLQQMLRARSARRQKSSTQTTNEIRPDNAAVWKAEDHIDWLLLQIDFNFRIRPDQLEVAQAMISPKSASNFVLQMNMGQGKSSVIIPMLVAQLADGKNLVRVVVPRPLLLQTAQLLQTRLGGLVGRRIKHIPFSRKSSTEIGNLKAYHGLHIDILRRRGVILTLPEHMLFFQLSGLQQLSNGHMQHAKIMMDLQQWMNRKTMDILDECDHMLAVKTQLIYPSGGQSLVDAHPTRWCVVQDLLKLVKTHMGRLRRQYPKSIEVIERSSGTFPTVYLLDQVAKDALTERLKESVLRGEGDLLPTEGCSNDEMAFVNSFLHQAQFPKNLALKVTEVFKNKPNVRQRLLMLRGLLIHRILLMGLSKRWNVQYGIDPRRDPIAVPYRSKGIPSDQAEFGHPDVSIILTCLSFYYAGLTLLQFQQNLSLLLKSDEPVREFESWKHDVKAFPESLNSFDSINVDDDGQCTQLWTILRLQMSVINYFLNHFVFPRHARTFERKLVSSAWDIASSPGQISTANLKENAKPGRGHMEPVVGEPTSLTVGFSGTNDGKTLLPLNVLQSDLPGLAHTNAEVLTYLLQPRNRRYYPASDAYGKRLSERAFLQKLKDLRIRMILDAGALILELDNVSLARVWLQVDHEAEAAVYFGEDDRARVIYRDGKCQPLAGSPYLNNLGSCLVYLDEAHTRGIDLMMPADAKAAVTLGIMQTKDHTVQAAMRLRQLAISQSVAFFAPPEVHQSILNLRGKTNDDFVDSFDVITWLLEQTCCNIEQLHPLYISQGLEYCRRQISAHKNPEAASQHEQRKAYLKVLEQPEQYSLEQLYAPDQRLAARTIDTNGFSEVAKYVDKLNVMKKQLRNTSDTLQALAHQEVEQEREVQIEVEQEREIKKPHHVQALPQPPLQKEIKTFAETGRLVAGSQAFQQAFVALRQTALGRRLRVTDSATKSQLFVTQDFISTVCTELGRPRDEYSRSVHWLLWSIVTDTALVVSDFEANNLLPLIRLIKLPLTHLVTYSAPVNRHMVVFDTLKFYAVPPLPESWSPPAWLVRDLGIFAGRLYFDYNAQYRAVYEAMGLSMPVPTTPIAPAPLSEADLLAELPYGDSQEAVKKEPFSPSPLIFMQEWLAIRRKGQDFSQTMMGKICWGRRLDRYEIGIAEETETLQEV